jgi:S-adenosylmethionine:tRNA ribosyltransferase-isomerase
VRLVVVGRGVEVRDFDELPEILEAGDLLVVNDAATWPASLSGRTAAGLPLEIRLTSGAIAAGGRAWVVVFGAGDWRTRTEDRPAPPELAAGDVLRIAGLEIVVTQVRSRRLIEIEVPGTDAAVRALFAAGRPVQYAHLRRALAPWDVQTVYGGRPWAVEMPSAGRPLTWRLIAALAGRGVRVVALTHAAGLSSTGDDALDATLPWPERFEIPEVTAAAIAETRARGGRVVAVGTTVVRALEGAAQAGVRSGITDLRLGPTSRPVVVDAVLSGLHDPSDSHFRLLEAFAPRAILVEAWQRARDLGLAGHELGDSLLVLRYPP